MTLKSSEIRAAKAGTRLNAGRGLLLFTSANGTKSWRLRFKRDGKDAIKTIGHWPEMSADEAIQTAAALRKGVKLGVDAGAQVEREEALPRIDSFQDTAERYMKREEGHWSDGHMARFRNRMENDVFPVIGNLPVGEVTPADVVRAIRPIEERNAQNTALRVVGMIGQVCRFAVARGLRQDDPTAHLAGGLDRAPRAKHRPAIVHPEGVGQLMADLHDWHGDTVAKPLLLLCAYLFQRPGEIASMRWADVDLDRGVWSFHVTKVDIDHIVPLPEQAVAILRDLERGRGRSDFVFRSSTKSGYISPQLAPNLLDKLGYKGTHCAHGFRATARTLIVEEMRFDPELVERQLSHTVRAVHGRAYDRTAFLEARMSMVQQYADYLDKIAMDAGGLKLIEHVQK